MYQRFSTADVHESDGISKALTLSIEGSPLATVDGARSTLHVEEDDKQLRLYVPKDRKDRELCFLNTLPSRLVTHLGIIDRAAVKVFGDIFKGNAYLLDDLLTELGLGRLPWADPVQHQVPDDEPLDDRRDTGELVMPIVTPERPTRSRASTPGVESRDSRLTPSPSPRLESRTQSSYANSFSTPISQSSTLFPGTPRLSYTPVPTANRLETTSRDLINNEKYIALLEYVIASANGGES